MMALLHSTLLYITLPWLYFIVLDSTLFYHGSTSLYLTLHYPALVHHSTSLYITLLRLYLHSTLHYSTMSLLHITLP